MTTDLCAMTATALLDAYRKRTLSPVEVAQSILKRMEALNPRLNAFNLISDQALDEAKALAVEAINFLATPLELTSRGLILDRMAALRLLRFINGQIRRKKAV